MNSRPSTTDAGFTLVEVLMAISVASLLSATATLFLVSMVSVQDGQDQTVSVALAAQKMEELSASVAPGHRSAPADSLDVDRAGFHEVVDSRGTLASGATRQFVRRWHVRPLSTDSAALIVAVRVVPNRDGIFRHRGSGARVSATVETLRTFE